VSIRVAVVDDQALVRGGLAMVLDHQPDIEVVAEAGNGREAVAAARNHRPDVVLMDIRMPEMDGLQATAQIVDELGGAVRVLILTTFEPDEYVYRALRAGASGFVLKDIPPEQLVVAVRTVAEGGALLAPSVTRRLIGRFAAQHAVDTGSQAGSRSSPRVSATWSSPSPADGATPRSRASCSSGARR
jgi:DNA-binding NarL/FixJ family response regulator